MILFQVRDRGLFGNFLFARAKFVYNMEEIWGNWK